MLQWKIARGRPSGKFSETCIGMWRINGSFRLCHPPPPPPPPLSGCILFSYYFHPQTPDATSIFLFNDLLCIDRQVLCNWGVNYDVLGRGGGGGWAQTEKIRINIKVSSFIGI